MRRLEAEAKNSSEKVRMRGFRGAEMRSVGFGVSFGSVWLERAVVSVFGQEVDTDAGGIEGAVYLVCRY